MQLTPHFTDAELGVQLRAGYGATPQQFENAAQLCSVLLEPIREHLNGPISLSCGYRPPADNEGTGGASNSQHLYLGLNSAADMDKMPVSFQEAFDWIRLESHLDFDQLILEKSKATGLDACVHISYNGALAVQRREALVGETHGTGKYTRVQVNP